MVYCLYPVETVESHIRNGEQIAMAMAFGGKLSYDPTRDRIVGADGLPFVFEPPDNDNVPEAALHADDDQDSLLTVASNREGTRIEMRPSQQ